MNLPLNNCYNLILQNYILNLTCCKCIGKETILTTLTFSLKP